MSMTDLDRRQRERRDKARQEAAGDRKTGDKPRPAAGPAKRKGDRWAAYNSFVDVIAPRLTLAERAVWHVMFRHARDGVVNTSERALATAARIDKATAGRALRRLVQLRLAWVIHKSASKESTSRYGLCPQPATRLAAVIEEDDRRQSEARQRRERNGGDCRGRRRREHPTG